MRVHPPPSTVPSGRGGVRGPAGSPGEGQCRPPSPDPPSARARAARKRRPVNVTAPAIAGALGRAGGSHCVLVRRPRDRSTSQIATVCSGGCRLGGLWQLSWPAPPGAKPFPLRFSQSSSRTPSSAREGARTLLLDRANAIRTRSPMRSRRAEAASFVCPNFCDRRRRGCC